jgi:hypothetical protein
MQRPIVAHLSLKGMSAREIHDNIIATLGPDAVSHSSVQLPATLPRHNFLLRNQNPIQPTFKEISMIQIRLFEPFLKTTRLRSRIDKTIRDGSRQAARTSLHLTSKTRLHNGTSYITRCGQLLEAHRNVRALYPKRLLEKIANRASHLSCAEFTRPKKQHDFVERKMNDPSNDTADKRNRCTKRKLQMIRRPDVEMDTNIDPLP